jgi:peptidyl-prolyl cis-trans isomerase SurA
MNFLYFEGVRAIVQKSNFKFLSIVFLAIATFSFTACGPTGGQPTPDGKPPAGEAAAKVNGKVITNEEVERAVKQQAQGQEAKLSQLELAQVRLQALDQLIQNEVMYQKADSEKTVPADDEVTTEYNKVKTDSKLSAEEFAKQMTAIGQTEESARDSIKKRLAVTKLMEKVTGKVEPPKDAEIEAFFNGNKEAFVKKKGVKLAAIVIDPADNGEGDTTKDEVSAVNKGNEIIRQLATGGDFAAIAREKSEDQSGVQGGDLGYVSEEELKKSFPPQALNFMNPKFPVGQTQAMQMQGKFYILKLQERSDKDEAQTLETPGVRQQITDGLVNARKSLVSASYSAIAMNEAKIENYLAKRVYENPNELSGSRPAVTETPNANANTNSNVNTNTNVNSNVNAKAGDKKDDAKKEEPKKEEAKTATANTASNTPAANTNANAGK